MVHQGELELKEILEQLMLLLDPLGHLDLPFLEPPELRVSPVPLDVPDVMELKEQL